LDLEMIDWVFQKFGLEMHIGRGEQWQKTEIMYIPKPSFYQPPTNNTIETPPTPHRIASGWHNKWWWCTFNCPQTKRIPQKNPSPQWAKRKEKHFTMPHLIPSK
jgi:hypothetical protein